MDSYNDDMYTTNTAANTGADNPSQKHDAGAAPTADAAQDTGANAITVAQAAAVEHIGKPAPGSQVTVEVVPGHQYDFDFPRSDADFVYSGNDLVILVHDGGEIILKNFGPEAAGHQISALNFAGETIDALDLLQHTASAEDLANITPAAGPGAGGGILIPGASFAPFAPGPLPPGIPEIGPVPPTSLAFAPPELTPFVFTNPELPAIGGPGFCEQMLNFYLTGFLNGTPVTVGDLVDEFGGFKGDIQSFVTSPDCIDESAMPGMVTDIVLGLIGAHAWRGGEFTGQPSTDADSTIVGADDATTFGDNGNNLIIVGGGSGDGDETLVGDGACGQHYLCANANGSGQTINQFNDTIIAGGGGSSGAVLVGDLYVTGCAWASIDAKANGSEGNSVNAFNDVLIGGSDGDTLVGDVYSSGFGGVHINAQASGGGFPDVEDLDGPNTVSAFNDWLDGGDGNDVMVGDVFKSGIGDVCLSAGAEGFGNTVEAFNDVILGGNGDNTMVGDVAFQGCFGDITLTAAATSAFFSEGGGNQVFAFNDFILGGTGNDFMVGDVARDGGNGDISLTAEATGGYYGYGGENTVSAFNDFLCSDSGADTLIGDVYSTGGNGNVDLSAQVSGDFNFVFAFNDVLVSDGLGGGQGNVMIGDVAVGSLPNVGPVESSVSFSEGGEITLSATTCYAFGGGVFAYNDVMLESGGANFMVGDVYASEISGQSGQDGYGGGLGVDVVGGPIDGGNGGDGGNLSIDLTASADHSICTTVVAFSDSMVGGDGNDVMTGDVYASFINGGAGGAGGNGYVGFGGGTFGGLSFGYGGEGGNGGDGGDVNLGLTANICGGFGNTVYAFNDVMSAGGDNNFMVGDVAVAFVSGGQGGQGGAGLDGADSFGYGGNAFSGADGGNGGNGGDVNVDLVASVYSGAGNAVVAFSDAISAAGGNNLMAGDVDAYLISGGQGGQGGQGGLGGNSQFIGGVGEDFDSNTGNGGYGGDGGNGGDGGDARISLVAAVDGCGNAVAAYNDCMTAGGGANEIVGDVIALYISGGNGGDGGNGGSGGHSASDGGFGGNGGQGGDGGDGGNADICLSVYAAGNGNTVSAANDHITVTGNGGNDFIAGDVVAQGVTGGNGGYGGNGGSAGGGGTDGGVAGHGGKGGDGGNGGDATIELTAIAACTAYAVAVSAFNDTIASAGGSEVIVGDVSASDIRGGDGGAAGDSVNIPHDGNGGDATVHLAAVANGGSGNSVTAFDDQISVSGGNDQIVGDVYANSVEGGAAGGSPFDNNVHGHDGHGSVSLQADANSNNTVDAYNDVISVGGGNDAIYGDVYASHTDCVSLEADADGSATVNAFNDQIFAVAGNDIIVGDVGTDNVSFINMIIDPPLSSTNAHIDAFGDLISVTGGGGNDLLVGDAYIQGDSEAIVTGDPTLHMSLFDGGGNDTINGFDNTITGGDGGDTLIGNVAMIGYDNHLHIDVTDTTGASDTINGFDDTLTGGNGSDSIVGDFSLPDSGVGSGDANISVKDTGTSDTLTLFSDSIDGGAGNDTIWGDSTNDSSITLNDTVGAGDKLFSDTIDGGLGDDWIHGGIGNDVLTGGGGNDTFDFNLWGKGTGPMGNGDGNDEIKDWNKANDVLSFHNVLDGAGNDHQDLVDSITNITNDGTNTTIHFTNGANLQIDGIVATGGTTSAQLDSLVNNAATQIVVAHS